MKKTVCILMTLILCLTALTSCSPKDEYVPAGFKKISNDNADHVLYVPEGWVFDMSTGVTTAYVSDKDLSNITFTSFDLDSSVIKTDETGEGGEKADILDSYWDYYSAEFEKTFSEMKYEVEGEDLLVSKIKSKKYIYTATVTGNAYKFMQVVTIKGNAVYVFTYTALEESNGVKVFDSHLSDVNKIVGYIEIK